MKNKKERGVVLIISIVSAVVVVLLVVTLLLISRGQERTAVTRSLEKRAFFRAEEAGHEAIGEIVPHVKAASPPGHIDIGRRAVVYQRREADRESITIEDKALNAPPAPPGYDLDSPFGRVNRFYIINARGEAKEGFLRGRANSEIEIVIRAYM